ncbi:MAG: hypothetical protein GXO11_06870 [Epsilonproteobacteria bacterium]|nr:hypothetical protein [Campylobacterota bacterium]
MQDFAQWSLDAIREEGASLSWLEELRFEWVIPTASCLYEILNGKTIILITDGKREWFEKYILHAINANPALRPLIPIINIESIYPAYNSVKGGEMLEMVEDMIRLSFGDNFIFWYIGRGEDKRADIAKRRDDSYFWIFDEDYQNSFKLNSHDSHLDIKLLQLYRLFDQSLNAAIFGEIDIDI